MLKVKDFVFALLTLICVSQVVGEEQVYPEAKVWPFIEGFEWGISEDEFYEACAKKKFERMTSSGFTQRLGDLLNELHDWFHCHRYPDQEGQEID